MPYIDIPALQGLNRRWWISFNFTILRLISFTLDTHWSSSSSKRKSASSLPASCFLFFLTYTLYTPLYLAGPIISYSDFSTQFSQRKSIHFKSLAWYFIRWILALMLMEVMMHAFYVVAISKSPLAWHDMTAFEISMVGFFNLKFVWLKVSKRFVSNIQLLVMWRFFRLWAMADGIETTENMTRCMSNNYSVMGFWRSWHRSYNRWLVRCVNA